MFLFFLALLQGSTHVPPKQILGPGDVTLIEILRINFLLDLPQLLLPLLLALVEHAIHIQVHVLLQVRRVEVNLLLLLLDHPHLLLLDLRPLGRYQELLGALRQLPHLLRLPLQHLRTSYEEVLLQALLSAVGNVVVLIIVTVMYSRRLDFVRFARFEALGSIEVGKGNFVAPKVGLRGVSLAQELNAEHYK